ncbi:nuclear envelope integral membrane protein 1-like [Gigantopelta aegis]|uniref:nuclear envelope integral membrane protein 1-like n=1 Tax=Gigantopelta aegis TaxID=1735272 RepID=UPI001B889E28|nr:nuclear envelope integral membrane protein 1-like [Gigantopelta aegis]
MAANLIVILSLVFICLLCAFFGYCIDANSVVALDDCKKSNDCFVVGEHGQGASLKVKDREDGRDRLMTICYRGQDREIYRLWVNPRVQIHPAETDQKFQYHFGPNLTAVQNDHASRTFSVFNWLQVKEEFSMNPFNVSCLGIVSNKKYSIDFKIRNPELWYVAYVVVGIVIFFCADSWSRNTALHYTTGVSVGILASVLIALFVISRFLPQTVRRLTYLIGMIGGSVFLYCIKFIQTELQVILKDYWQYVVGYIVVFGFISFAVVYKFGPVTNPRTLDLVRWILQGTALCLVYSGTQLPEASVAIIIVMLSVHNFPKKVTLLFKRLRYRFFRPKIRFLTEEEYIEQGQFETERALAELRDYCRSPDCDSWKVVSRLQSPQRFANFIGGECHVLNDEVVQHDSITDFEIPSETEEIDESDTELQFS